MTVTLVFNSASGRGGAKLLARTLADALDRAGYEVIVLDARSEFTEHALAGSDALVVCGGDGTVLHASAAASRADVPLYHVPMGNENLFSRAMGSTRNPEDLISALRARRIERLDRGLAQKPEGPTEPFLLMWSTGPDASVLSRLARSSVRPNGHAAYIRPVFAEFFKPMLPRVTIRVDGQPLVNDTQGWVIVANCAQYACRCNFAAAATMTDGMLDVVFIPAKSSIRCCLALARARVGVLRQNHKRIVSSRGRRIEIAAVRHDGIKAQVDGEPSKFSHDHNTLEVVIDVDDASLPVLVPPTLQSF